MRTKGHTTRNIATVGITVCLTVGAIILGQSVLPEKTKSQVDIANVKAAVSKLMILPSNEEPTLASVQDKSKLADEFLRSKTENGDKVLVYTDSHLVIVYRPSIQKIAAVGVANVDPAYPESKGTTIIVKDGSNNPAKTKQILDTIRSEYPDSKVTDGGKTNKQDFQDTIVIDNSNNKDYLVEALTVKLPGKRGIVPLSEPRTDSDIEVIVGVDSGSNK